MKAIIAILGKFFLTAQKSPITEAKHRQNGIKIFKSHFVTILCRVRAGFWLGLGI